MSALLLRLRDAKVRGKQPQKPEPEPEPAAPRVIKGEAAAPPGGGVGGRADSD